MATENAPATHQTVAATATVHENWSTIWDRVAAAAGDRTAVISPTGTLTYRQLEQRAAALAATLAARGVGPGDRIGIFLYNRPEYLETIYAAFKLGAVPVNVNYRYRAAELATVIRVSGATALVYPTSLTATVSEARPAFAELTLLAVADDAEPALPSALPYEQAATASPSAPPGTPGRLGGDDQIFLFTGGTTGTPKAVVWRHGALFHSQRVSIYGSLGVPFPTDLDQVVAIATDPAHSPPVTLPIAPLMHTMAMFNTMNTLVLGGTVVFLNAAAFNPAVALAAVANHRVSRVIIAGDAIAVPLAEELERAAAAGTRYDTASVRLMMSAGMLWSDRVKAALLRHLDATLFDILGASEGGPFAYCSVSRADDLPSALVLTEGATVLSEDGSEVDPDVGGIGVLAYHGPMPDGYFDDPARTAEVYRTIAGRRYVVPGDYVRLCPGRRIEFLGRGATVVNTGGEKVYPAEVEECLLTHPDVADVAVLGLPDPRFGQIVAAVVAPRAGVRPDGAALAAYVGARLAGYKKPRKIIIVDTVERSPSGKLNLRGLAALAANTPGWTSQ